MEHSDKDNWALLGRMKKDEDAMTTLFYRHKDYVYRLAVGFVGDHHLADDITQDVFLRLARLRRPVVARASFRTWLYRVTLNTTHEFLRKAKRRSKLLQAFQEDPSAPTSLHSFPEQQLKNALDQLPPRQREAVVLRYFEQLSIRDTAHVMGCREGTIKATLHNALRNLRNAMTAKAEGDPS